MPETSSFFWNIQAYSIPATILFKPWIFWFWTMIKTGMKIIPAFPKYFQLSLTGITLDCYKAWAPTLHCWKAYPAGIFDVDSTSKYSYVFQRFFDVEISTLIRRQNFKFDVESTSIFRRFFLFGVEKALKNQRRTPLGRFKQKKIGLMDCHKSSKVQAFKWPWKSLEKLVWGWPLTQCTNCWPHVQTCAILSPQKNTKWK